MNNEDCEQRRQASESIPHSTSPPQPEEPGLRQEGAYKPRLTGLSKKILALPLAVMLLVIGLMFLMFRRDGGSDRKLAMSQRWPRLAHLKDRLQALLRDIQRETESGQHIIR